MHRLSLCAALIALATLSGLGSAHAQDVEFFWGDERSVPPDHPAMGMMIFYANVTARIIHHFLSKRIYTSTQAWRTR